MTKKGAIKTGILSFGLSGKVFQAPFIDAHKKFNFKAIVERSTKKAQNTYPEITSYDNVETLFADPEIELIIVNTPNNTHFEFAMEAIKAKKHVLMEKPFTVLSSEAKQLFKEAKKADLHILPYQNRRYDSDFLSVKEILTSGRLGKPVELHLRFDRYKYVIENKAMKEHPVPGSGLLYDLGPHLLDASISLFGNPLEWNKRLGHFRPNTKVDDYAHIQLLYPDELQVFITTSMLVADPQPSFILHGTKGSFVKQRADIQEHQLSEGLSPSHPTYGIEELGKEGLLTTFTKDGTKQHEKIIAPKGTYMHVFNDVYNTIREGKTYPITLNQIIQQLEILEN